MRSSLLAAVLFAILFVLTEGGGETSVPLRPPLQTAQAKRIPPKVPSRPFRLGNTYVYPPLTRAPAPLLVMLHGMCGDGRGVCEFWDRAGREASWLVCPNGNAACGNASDWRGDGETKARYLDGVIAALDTEQRALVTHHGDILAGFSRGAFVARDVAYARPGRFRGLVLLGAALVPDPKRLSGIRRVVLGAGDFDGARPTMQRAARVLQKGGIDARYVSLGPIPHALPHDLEHIMRDALSWIRE